MLVTHDPDVGDACDRIVRMRDGRIREDQHSAAEMALAPPPVAPQFVGIGAT